MFVLGFPLLLIPFAVYNMIAFLTPGVSWTAAVTTVHMMSGTDWILTWEDLFIAFAIFLLWIEICTPRPTPETAGSRSSAICPPCSPLRSKHCHDRGR